MKAGKVREISRLSLCRGTFLFPDEDISNRAASPPCYRSLLASDTSACARYEVEEDSEMALEGETTYETKKKDTKTETR